jgi:hypothetical protein
MLSELDASADCVKWRTIGVISMLGGGRLDPVTYLLASGLSETIPRR